ncbi:MAG TPA: spore germination protein, partial [Bacillota bacterium]|nr:spore germination protein [Bacillota bacterium]
SLASNGTNPVSANLNENLSLLKQLFKEGSNLVTGTIAVAGGLEEAGIAYIEGLVNVVDINEHILAPLTHGNPEFLKKQPKDQWLRMIRTHLVTNINITETDDMEQLGYHMLEGGTALFIQGIPSVLVIGTRKIEKRGVEAPDTELALHGSKDSFTEDINTNCILIRRRLPTPRLQFREIMVGRLSRTKVRLCWIDEVAEPEILNEICKRLEQIDIDYVGTLGAITELIEDSPLSIFPQYRKTQRPDRASADLAEGRIAILVDGFPYALVVPLFILQELQTVDDYTEKPILGTLLRSVRYLAIFISVMMTPLYLSFVAYNHTIIPPSLAQRIAMGREGLPFPSFVEVILVTGLLDVLREAGLRLPPSLGGAISVLGAVVIGQAAISAGYFSPSAIIVMAVTAISAFAIPSPHIASATRVLNYFLIFLAGISGIFGVILGVILIVWRINCIRSFGVSISHPLESGHLKGFKDILIRAPFWRLRKRPQIITNGNSTRMGPGTQKPTPPEEKVPGENNES